MEDPTMNDIYSYCERKAVVKKTFYDEQTVIMDKLRKLWSEFKHEVMRDVIRIIDPPDIIKSKMTDIDCPYYYLIGENVENFYIEFTINDFPYYVRCSTYIDNSNGHVDIHYYTIGADVIDITEFKEIRCSFDPETGKSTIVDIRNTESTYTHPLNTPQMKTFCINTISKMIEKTDKFYSIFQTVRRLADRYFEYPIIDTRKSVLLILGSHRKEAAFLFNMLPSEIVLIICKLAMIFDD